MHMADYAIPLCLACECPMRRRYTPPAGIHLFEERHHHGIGEYVTSKHHLKEVCKRKAEEYEARTGIATEYEPL